MFRARRPSIFSTCHKMPPLPLNLQVVNTIRKKTRNTARPKCRACHDMQNDAGGLQSAAHAMENATHPLKTTQNQKYRACHTKRLSTRHETCWNVTKRHACHAKRGFATFETETSKSDHFCRTRLRHGHIGP